MKLPLKRKKMYEKKEWLSPQELYMEFGFSLSTQAKYRQRREIPYSKVGKYIRYNRERINQWLFANEKEVA